MRTKPFRGEQVVKCKGIPLNVTTSEVVNFQAMLSLVKGMEEQYMVTQPHKIQRDAKRRKLMTVEQDKVFQIVYDKRVRCGVTTVPYGFR